MKSLLRVTTLAFVVAGFARVSHAQTLTFSQLTYPGNTTYSHADLNNDGREDLVYPTVAPYGPSGFTVVLSTGDDAYARPVFYAAPNGVQQNIVLIDLNNDGYPDLVTWSGAGYFYEYLNDKNGKFTLHSTDQLPTSMVISMVAGDFNHDGYQDLAYMAPGTGNGGQIHVLFNNHAGGFTTGPVTNTPSASQMVAGDFDGDGKADLYLQGGAQPTICYGDNDGHFSAQTKVSIAHAPILFPMDLDGDGKTDLVGAGAGWDATTNQPICLKDLFVVYGTANRTVTEAAIPLQGYPVQTATGSQFSMPVADQADFNGDGHADLVVVESMQENGGGNTRRIVVLTGKGNREFNPEEVIYTDESGGLDLTAQAIHATTHNSADILADVFSDNAPTAHIFLNDTSAWFGGCPLPASATGIHLCSPTTYSSTRAAFSLSAAGIPLMHRMELWVDGVKKSQQFARDYSHAAFLDGTITLPVGTHKVTVYAAGEDNSLQSRSYTITVK